MVTLYFYFTEAMLARPSSRRIVMLVTGFFFAAVSGQPGRHDRLVEQPDLRPDAGHRRGRRADDGHRRRDGGHEGVLAVLGVAAIGCVSSAVAGEMLQDLKVGHILGGTPWKMQVGDIIGVVFAGLVMFFPLYMMHTSDVAQLRPRARRLRRQDLPGAAGRPDGGPLAGHRRRARWRGRSSSSASRWGSRSS